MRKSQVFVGVLLLFAAVLAVGCAIGLLGCGKENGTAKSQGPVVLKVNGWSYSAADLEKEIRSSEDLALERV